MSQPAAADDLLARGVVRLRRLPEGEAPFAGWLARVDGEVVQLVDTSLIREWAGWRDQGEHVLAVHDVVRTAVGHEAVVPWCVERLAAFLGRRAGSGAGLSDGERVTIAVSLLRGYVAGGGAALIGEWWITQDGTPTFVATRQGEKGEPLGRAAAVLLEKLDEATGTTRMWDIPGLAARLRAGEHPGGAEMRIFASAQPEPLILTPLTPRRVAEARAAETLTAFAAVLPPRSTQQTGLARLVGRHVDTDVGTMVSEALEAIRRGSQRARRRLGHPWFVAAGLAALIVSAGIAWPSDTEPANARPAASKPGVPELESTTPSTPEASSAANADVAPGALPLSPDEAARGNDPVAALSALLARRALCTDEECAPAIFEDPAAFTDVPRGAVNLAEDDRETSLLDDLGGVAVLSVRDRRGSEPAQYVILVRTPDGWLIRTVRDVDAP